MNLEEPRLTWRNPDESGGTQVDLEEPRLTWRNPG